MENLGWIGIVSGMVVGGGISVVVNRFLKYGFVIWVLGIVLLAMANGLVGPYLGLAAFIGLFALGIKFAPLPELEHGPADPELAESPHEVERVCRRHPGSR